MAGHLLTPSSARSLLAPGIDGAKAVSQQDTQSAGAHTHRNGNRLRSTGKEQRHRPRDISRWVATASKWLRRKPIAA